MKADHGTESHGTATKILPTPRMERQERGENTGWVGGKIKSQWKSTATAETSSLISEYCSAAAASIVEEWKKKRACTGLYRTAKDQSEDCNCKITVECQ